MSSTLSGSSVAIATPMKKGGDIDYGAFAELLEWHIEQGTESIVVAGTTGEAPTLGVDEHQNLIARAVAIVNGAMPIIAGVGANCTREAIDLTQQAQADGATAGLSVVPYYNKPTQEGLYRHFSAIAEAVNLPLIVYDIPGRSVVKLEDSTIGRLSAISNIVGVKDAVGDVTRPFALRNVLAENRRDDFLLISGDDKTALAYLLAGGDGVISVTSNIAPAKMRAMIDAARAGDSKRAHRLDADLRPFHIAQGLESNPIPVKAALAMMGKMEEGIRLPLTPLLAGYREALSQALESAQRNLV